MKITAKAKGIRFRTTPSWQKLATAFNYFEILQALTQAQVETNPQPSLGGVSMEFKLD